MLNCTNGVSPNHLPGIVASDSVGACKDRWSVQRKSRGTNILGFLYVSVTSEIHNLKASYIEFSPCI